MRKAPTIFLLVVSLLCHTFAIAQAGLVQGHGDGIAHIAMHLEEEPHHHHDDGTFHQDGSDESVKHVDSDGCANTAGAIPTNVACAIADFGAHVHFVLTATVRDSPVLDGPRRPPRFTA